MASRALWKRQSNGGTFDDDSQHNDDDYDGYSSWWWSPAGMAVRYAIVAILFGSILLFLLGGYYSTQRRLRQGLPPRPAFRWMVRRRHSYYYSQPYRNQYPQQQQQYAHYSDPNSQGYGLHGYPAPPPPYVNGDAPPPVYQPPQGASKAMPDQNVESVGRAGEASSSADVDRPLPAVRP